MAAAVVMLHRTFQIEQSSIEDIQQPVKAMPMKPYSSIVYRMPYAVFLILAVKSVKAWCCGERE